MSTPKSLILYKLSKESTARITGSFLDTQDLINVSKTCRQTRKLFQPLWAVKIAQTLLKHVLNADPKKVKEILDIIQSRSKEFNECIILMRVSVREETWSKSQKKMIVKREWNKINAIEAAALSGNTFLLNRLLLYISKELRPMAAVQLQDILKRGPDAENGVYLAPFKTLINAYQNYLDQYLIDRNNYEVLNCLWLKIGTCQSLLPAHGLQVFCDQKPHHPILPNTFKNEPKRRCLIPYNPDDDEYECDLDVGGLGIDYSLFKGSLWSIRTRSWSYVTSTAISDAFPFDLEAIRRLCEVRKSELEYIIKFFLSSASQVENNSEDSIHTRDLCVIF